MYVHPALSEGDILLKPIMSNAGKDISHWFDRETGEVSVTALLGVACCTQSSGSTCSVSCTVSKRLCVKIQLMYTNRILHFSCTHVRAFVPVLM